MKSSFSDKIYSCLAAKVIKFNEENTPRVTLNQLIRVYKRGEKPRQFSSLSTKAPLSGRWPELTCF